MRDFQCIRVRTSSREDADRILAAVCDPDFCGAQELAGCEGEGPIVVLYAARGESQKVREIAARSASRSEWVGTVEDVETIDWSTRWKQGFEVTVISETLAIRPSFVAPLPAHRGAEIVIDPGQAFGTGTHASTRLALEWIDAVAPDLTPGSRVLDAGTGSGVLALAALARGADWALGFDTDPRAIREARATVDVNSPTESCHLFCGGVEAIALERFELVVANLLRSELEPILDALATRMTPSGSLILSGLLESDRARVSGALLACGLHIRGTRTLEQNGDLWLGLLTGRG